MKFAKLRTAALFASVCIFSFVAEAANAAVIVEYQTAASTSNATLSASVADPSVTADNMAAGPGLTANTGSTWNWRSWDLSSSSFAAAVAAGDFWTWGFDVTALNTTIDLTNMDIRLDRSGTGPDDFEIQASVNGGTAVSILTHNYNDSDSGVDFLGIDLSGIGTLVTGDSLVFTLAAFNSENGSAGTFDLETVDFNGADPRALRISGTVGTSSTADVPEPSSLAIIGIGGFVSIAMIRRRK